MKEIALVLLGIGLTGMPLLGATPSNQVALIRTLSIQAHEPRSRVGALEFSPDDNVLASGGGTTDSIGSHGDIKLWSASNGVLIAELKGHGGLVDALAFRGDGKTVAAGGYKLVLWDVAKRKKLKTMKPDGLVHALAFSPDGALLVSACRGQPYAQVWDSETGKPGIRLHGGVGREQTVVSIDFSPNGRLLALGGTDQPATIWDRKTWLRQAALTNATDARSSASYVKFSPGGILLFTKGEFSIPGRLWNITEGRVAMELQGDNDLVSDVDFSPDGAFLATGGMDCMNLWEVKTGRRVQSAKGQFWSVAFSHDGKLLALGCADGRIQVFRFAQGKDQRTPNQRPK